MEERPQDMWNIRKEVQVLSRLDCVVEKLPGADQLYWFVKLICQWPVISFTSEKAQFLLESMGAL